MTTDDEILARLTALRAGDLPVHGGRTMAYVYDSGLDGLEELANAAQAAFAGVNGLDMTAFPSVVELENDLVRRATALLGGSAGTFTSGGTESCLLAVLTARQYARKERGVTEPELVLPDTAHAAFHKAAELFGLRVVSVPVDPDTFTVRPADVAAAITDRTALVVVSAPSYAHGVIDPVADVAGDALRRGVPCHVDACIGGWYLGHLRIAAKELRDGEGERDGLGEQDLPDVPEFDLTVPGVTSLSVDLHKYAYTAKGASLLLFRDAGMRRHGWFAHAAWPGYPVVNSTLQGTKSAGPLAAAWAVTERVGAEGYAVLSTRVHRTTRALADGVERIGGLRLAARPGASLIAVASDDPDVDVFVVADELRGSGWYLQPQPAFGASPATLHLTVTAAVAHEETPRLLLAELEKAVERAREVGPIRVDPEVVEAAATLDPEALTSEEVEIALALAGIGDGGRLPERMAPVLAVLQSLPPQLSARLLPEVIGRLYRT
ncbi:pyridoxal phosphate-dependent decarboxylase family protein [Streptomyces sp. WG-D5]